MHEEYNRVLSTPTDADTFGHYGWYWYISETQISAQYISYAII